MRAHALRIAAWAALLALSTTGCMMAPSGALADFTYGNSLVGRAPSVDGGGGSPGSAAEVSGSTMALYQTAVGPIAWKGVQLARMTASGTSLLWNAPPDRNGQAIAIPQEGRGWAAGYGIARYQSGRWDAETTDVDAAASPTAPSASRLILTDVAFASGSVSVGYAVGTRGTILKYDASTRHWAKVSVPDATGEQLGSVKVLGASDVWVAGTVLLHFDGTTWTKVTSVPGEVSGLAALAANNVWATTEAGLYQWDGATWTKRFTPPSGAVMGAPAIASFGGTLVGLALETGAPSGKVFTYQDGAWKTEQVTVPADLALGLDTVVLASASTAYAKTADNSGVYRFDLMTKSWAYYSE